VAFSLTNGEEFYSMPSQILLNVLNDFGRITSEQIEILFQTGGSNNER